ncbi:MAG: LCP family protein [Pseudonocardia sp.]|nr:LCP family protein [Pseudonocardia sp.]
MPASLAWQAPSARRIGLRVVVATLSTAVLLATGIAWNIYRDLVGGISITDVIVGGFNAHNPGTDQNILLVGIDSRTDAKGRPLSKKMLAQLRSGADNGVLNSDTIILLHVPADGSRAIGFSIPRDSYVEIPGFGKNKINSAYSSAKSEAATALTEQGLDATAVEAESATAGRTTLIKAVERLTGVAVDHYAELNLLGFYNLTNAIGGVEVCLKAPVNEFRSGARFPAGRQTISGGAALAFVRQRYDLPQSDFSRIRRQQVFLASVAHKILSAGTLTNPTKLRSLINAITESVVLDSGWDVLAFARQAADLAGGKIQFMIIPTDGQATNERGDVVLVDPIEVSRFIQEKTSAEGASTAPDTATAATPPSELTVDVRNGTGRGGLARQVSDKLSERGYRTGGVDTGTERSHSRVYYAAGQLAAAEQLARVLGGMDTELNYKITQGRVRVYLGADFSLANIAAASSPSGSPLARVGSRASTSSRPSTPPSPPITADGPPCVD